MKQFQVRRDNYAQQRVVEDSHTPAIEEGFARARMERFAFTANNITYAVAGDMLGYWKFYPPLGEDAKGWGVIPVWGFAEITESNAEGVEPGDRFFGYWPPADEVLVKPAKVSPMGYIDSIPHRAALPATYNAYRRVAPSSKNDLQIDNEQMLLFPLFLTGFLIAEQIQDNDRYGAERIILLSASSKTSLGTAYALQGLEGFCTVLGMTSAGNKDFVSGLGVYDECASYDDIEALDASIPTTIVDMAGNTTLLGKLHVKLGDNMKQTIRVGVTHWEAAAPHPDMIADRSEYFFAPTRIAKLSKEWGMEGFQEKTNAFVTKTAAKSRDWLKLREVNGIESLQDEYDDVLNGKNDPSEGLVVIC